MNREKLLSGIVAFAIYLSVVALILYYFGYHTAHQKSTHFVTKNEKGIAVTLAGPPSPSIKKSPHKKREPKKKHRSKPRNVKGAKHTPARKHIKQAKPSRKPDAKKLFSHVKLPKQKTVKSAGAMGEKKKGERTLRKSKAESGVENAYLANVEHLLKGWPAQANFAGEEIDIRLTIYRDGTFDYKILKLSGNPDFNRELINYLTQLQRIGFGSHERKKPYEIEVKFIAHG